MNNFRPTVFYSALFSTLFSTIVLGLMSCVPKKNGNTDEKNDNKTDTSTVEGFESSGSSLPPPFVMPEGEFSVSCDLEYGEQVGQIYTSFAKKIDFSKSDWEQTVNHTGIETKEFGDTGWTIAHPAADDKVHPISPSYAAGHSLSIFLFADATTKQSPICVTPRLSYNHESSVVSTSAENCDSFDNEKKIRTHSNIIYTPKESGVENYDKSVILSVSVDCTVERTP